MNLGGNYPIVKPEPILYWLLLLEDIDPKQIIYVDEKRIQMTILQFPTKSIKCSKCDNKINLEQEVGYFGKEDIRVCNDCFSDDCDDYYWEQQVKGEEDE